ncbi:MAG: hypothetical protein MUC87_16730 [Bacteroidia bacterium]|jgi:hypothetical protein|nr:hypothetical protein [Bacteroidia bacterium]
MNHDETHILPPDSDDLSVHAPLLHSLQHTEGMVVPDGYFDGLADEVLAQVNLPAADGFTAQPENYEADFSERLEALLQLPESGELPVPGDYHNDFLQRIEAITSLPATSGLEVPDTYFDELAAELNAKLEFPSEKNSLTEAPEGYFENFEAELPALLALDNVKQDEGFALPDGYFNALTEKVMQRTSADILGEGADTDVPPDYFDTLPDRILAQTGEDRGGKVIALTMHTRSRIVAIAASVALLIGAAWWLMANNTATEGRAAGLASYKPLPMPRFETVQPAPEVIQVAEAPVVKKKNRINTQPETTIPVVQQKPALDVEMIDEYILADYAAEQLGQTVQPANTDNNAELRYYLENTELGDILDPID